MEWQRWVGKPLPCVHTGLLPQHCYFCVLYIMAGRQCGCHLPVSLCDPCIWISTRLQLQAAKWSCSSVRVLVWHTVLRTVICWRQRPLGWIGTCLHVLKSVFFKVRPQKTAVTGSDIPWGESHQQVHLRYVTNNGDRLLGETGENLDEVTLELWSEWEKGGKRHTIVDADVSKTIQVLVVPLSLRLMAKWGRYHMDRLFSLPVSSSFSM